MSNKSQTVNLTIPSELLKKVDALAKRNYTSRSDIIRQSLLYRLRSAQSSQLDEWGDPVSENWQKVVDFREHGYPDGIPADEFTARLKKIDRQNK